MTTSSAMLSYLAPYNGVALAEFLRDNGYAILVCIDDVSKHAVVYRQISLIAGRVPGRDAYPADVFNVHAGLLERCCRGKWIYGNGSITGFPVVETINDDVTEYIATNLISITDGQIYTNGLLFKNGFRPAVDSGLSVSRVGSSAQCLCLKRYVGQTKNDLTNYRFGGLNRVQGMAIELVVYQD